MPRKTRKQPGTSGGAYANRTDRTQPVAVPTGLPYGERQALMQTQQQAPLPQTAGTPGTPQGPPQDPALAAAAAHNFQPVNLGAPTNRPNEPIQHGLPSGPGGGPEVLGNTDNTADVLMRLAASTSNPAIQALANQARQFNV